MDLQKLFAEREAFFLTLRMFSTVKTATKGNYRPMVKRDLSEDPISQHGRKWSPVFLQLQSSGVGE